MPPIPKFAKALAEFAKANPKAIPGETIPKIKEKNILEKTIETSPKIKKRNTSEKTTEKQIKTKKFAKDDMELYKIRREKNKKELEQILPKKAKDDSDLLLVAKQFEKIDATKIQETEFNKKDKEVIKKGSKDDSILLKSRRKKIKAELKASLPKRSKDDLDLLLIEKKLRKMDIKKLKSNEIFQCAKDLKNTLETGNPLLEPLETIISMANTIDKTVDINSLLNITNKLMNVIK